MADASPPRPAPISLRGTLLGYLAFAVAIAAVWGIDVYAVPWTDPYLTDIVIRIGMALLAVMGLALVLGFTGQFSLGHAGFMAVGAYAAAMMSLHSGLHPMIGVLVGGFAAAVAGVVVGLPSLRLTGDYLAVVTLGFNGIIIVLIQNAPVLGGAAGLTGLPVATTFGWTFTWVLLGGLFIRNLLTSAHGRVFEAVRDNEIALRSLGVDTTRAKVVAFVVGAFWAGIAGGLLAHYRASIFPSQFQFDRSIEILAMVVLGGTGSLSGPLLSAAVLTALPEVLRPVAEYRMVIYSLLLIGMMILRPKGLLGGKEISDFFRRRPAAKKEAA
ncbi:MAG: branched-chain amino acid ABC transporter permease [Pseudomonadota bacterium]|nr:branched-chain amino acid ABC transporter permease [Pseudomonadota bacterium]